jgi:hypothetical protein
MNIRKNLKSFLGMPIGTRRSCLMKKTGHEKSRDTVPLRERKRKYCRVRKFIIGQHLGAHKRKYSTVRKFIIGQYWDDTRGSTVQ